MARGRRRGALVFIATLVGILTSLIAIAEYIHLTIPHDPPPNSLHCSLQGMVLTAEGNSSGLYHGTVGATDPPRSSNLTALFSFYGGPDFSFRILGSNIQPDSPDGRVTFHQENPWSPIVIQVPRLFAGETLGFFLTTNQLVPARLMAWNDADGEAGCSWAPGVGASR